MLLLISFMLIGSISNEVLYLTKNLKMYKLNKLGSMRKTQKL